MLTEPIEVKRKVGFVPESGAVYESLTGLEYLEMVAALYGIPSEAARIRIKQFLAFFDLGFDVLSEKLLGAYSKGMRRKVVITSGLLHNPPLVFFDEPLDGLDANAAVGFKAHDGAVDVREEVTGGGELERRAEDFAKTFAK